MKNCLILPLLFALHVCAWGQDCEQLLKYTREYEVHPRVYYNQLVESVKVPFEVRMGMVNDELEEERAKRIEREEKEYEKRKRPVTSIIIDISNATDHKDETLDWMIEVCRDWNKLFIRGDFIISSTHALVDRMPPDGLTHSYYQLAFDDGKVYKYEKPFGTYYTNRDLFIMLKGKLPVLEYDTAGDMMPGEKTDTGDTALLNKLLTVPLRSVTCYTKGDKRFDMVNPIYRTYTYDEGLKLQIPADKAKDIMQAIRCVMKAGNGIKK